jgi:hypothetical protein
MKRFLAISQSLALWAACSTASAESCITNVLHIGGSLPTHAKGVYEVDASELEPGDTPSVVLKDERTFGLAIPLRFTRVDSHAWQVTYGPTETDREEVIMGTLRFGADGAAENMIGGSFNPQPGSDHYGDTVTVDFAHLSEGTVGRDIATLETETIESPCYEAPKRVGYVPFIPAAEAPMK